MTKLYTVLVYGGLWAVALTAPKSDAAALIGDLFQFAGPDPWSVVVFNLMGVWPILFCAPLLWDGPGQRVPAWPFLLLSFAAGAFVLVPYLLLRCYGQPVRDSRRWLLWITHRNAAILLAFATVVLLGYAVIEGSLSEFMNRIANDGFVRTYTADFVALSLVYPVVALDDRRRLGIQGGSWIVFVPLFGAAWHMFRRFEVVRTA